MSPCQRAELPGGAVIICHGRARRRRCACGRWSAKLCDYKLSPPDRTCDKPLCDVCAVHVPGRDIDYCQEHADKLGVSLIL